MSLNKFKFWIYRKLVTKVHWVNLYNLVGSEGHSNTRADVHWALHKDIQYEDRNRHIPRRP